MQAIKQAIKKAMIEIADNQTNNQKVEDKKVEPTLEQLLAFWKDNHCDDHPECALEPEWDRDDKYFWHCPKCLKELNEDEDEDEEKVEEEIEEWDCHCGICGEENNNQCSGGCNPNKGRTCVCSDCGDKPDEEEEE